MKLNHKDKIQLGKRLSKTKEEREKHTGIFDTEEWDRIKKSKKDKQLNQGKKLKK